ncbi:MAG: PorT family protein [Rhodothermales bacterium]|nr:PorT family protein [Rhodothermales bacterium]
MSIQSRIFVSTLTFVMAAAVPAAHAQLGVAAGLNFDRLGDISTQSGAANFDNATGYHFGVFFDLGALPIAVRPGVFIRKAGDVDWNVTGVVESFDLTLIEVPIDVRIPLLQAPLLKPYLLGGPVVSFPRSNRDEIQDSFEDFLLSGSIGVGVEVKVPAIGLRLYPEVRYAFGVSRFMKDSFTIGGVSFDAEDSTRLSAVMVRLGVGL